MPYDCIVLAKQVPDTKNITGQAMRDDGTVNRAALPAVFNPEDRNALEMALQIRDLFGGTVSVLCMGAPSACEQLREALYYGADRVTLITDRRCAAADTLATSYALSLAVRKLGKFDLILGGRQAIDGDTAQTGPQLAEKLGLNQLTYVERILNIAQGVIEIERGIEGGFEIVRAGLPLLLTVTSTANTPRPARAKRLLQYRHYTCAAEIAGNVRKELESAGQTPTDADVAAAVAPILARAEAAGRIIPVWDADAIGADMDKIGLRGSATKVKKIDFIVLKGADLVWVQPDEPSVRGLVHSLVEEHILG